MKLSENFTLSEMCRSQTADMHCVTNEPGLAEVGALRALCEKTLQPLRDHMGEPLAVSSGFRCMELNRLITGSGRTSRHCLGQAADLVERGATAMRIGEIANGIVTLFNIGELDFDGLIFERHRTSAWVHISYNAALGDSQRHKVQVYDSGTYHNLDFGKFSSQHEAWRSSFFGEFFHGYAEAMGKLKGMLGG